MKNVATIFGKAARRKPGALSLMSWPLPEQLMGIEVEVESTKKTKAPVAFRPYWRTERDGSLRNGTEYVLASPLRGDTLSVAIGDLFHESVFERTTTGSTHVHLDMMEETTTTNTIKLLVLLAYIFEAAIFQLADPGREWCGYTNKLSSAPDSLVGSVLYSDENTEYSSLLHLCADGYRVGRYYGINLLALQEHGSIEFRYFPTATSPEELASWVRLVQCLKKAAMETDDVQHLARIIEDVDAYTQFVENYFGEWKDVFLSKVPHYQAVASLNKAFAVADSYHYNATVEAFNYDTLENSKLYSKFVKRNAKKRELPEVLVVGRVGQIPEPEDSRGQILLLQSGIYVSNGRMWVNLENATTSTGMTTPMLRDCLRALSNIDIVPRITEAGFSAGHIEQTRIRIRNLSLAVANIGNTVVPPSRAFNVPHVSSGVRRGPAIPAQTLVYGDPIPVSSSRASMDTATYANMMAQASQRMDTVTEREGDDE